MAAVGLVLILVAVFGLRDAMPRQVAEVTLPTSSSSPTSTPTVGPDSPATVTKPSPSADPTVPTKPEAPSKPASPVVSEAKYPKYPKTGDRIGTITLSALKISWPIFQGTTNAQLLKGVGHHLKSVLPGQSDNSVLAGHRTTVFNRLGELRVGQKIFVKTSAGTFQYRIRKFRIVDRSDRTVIVPTKTAVLTLVTCYPFDNIGVTTQSFVVVADQVQN